MLPLYAEMENPGPLDASPIVMFQGSIIVPLLPSVTWKVSLEVFVFVRV